MSPTKRKAVIQAVKDLRAGQFGATAIKVELEAQLNRGGGCDEGSHECGECSGNWEDARECYACEGYGYVIMQNGDFVPSREGEVEGSEECEECYGSGHLACEYCDEGYIDCDGDDDDTYSTQWCHEQMMIKMAALGLAEQRDNFNGTSHGLMTRWYPTGALKYAEFYTDGSVDSEFTFTLSLSNAANIMLLPKIVEAFTDLASEIDRGINIDGAGMHMALIYNKQCTYPSSSGMGRRATHFSNFSRSMKLLLPALYFLGSANGHSRAMGYRRPEVACESHRAAIDWRGGALEFRVFDTCYDTPETILDNVVVIRNCMRYWSRKYKTPKLEKITKAISFGNNSSYELERFYQTATHLDLLNAGLKKLKPSYYTIKEVKQQRKFGTTKHSLKSRLTEYKKGLKVEYTEYTERQRWSKEASKHQIMARLLERQAVNNPISDREAELARIQQQAEQEVESSQRTELTMQDFVKQKLEEYTQRQHGEYSIIV